ncbi:hypothetical protein PV08_01533 [Exophiala spinifera]|uniref:Uncharacterized protein n=1 Tax=Exophiala spinifera TaxID=91928 RepID=A0A0D2CBR8_9EURO|nr:uncharacterized protein PV08_01533 [Exophiala spinifera]KIW20954.1 hypothetical protein PV08_01533 [Exophiala spinifera]
MAPARAKVPEYPRPVSPVPVDDVPICADTIVYYDEQSDEEIDDEQRAAKKRRIQSYATSYLRGEPIFIATAHLNGPFGKGWRNPWLKKRKNTTQIRKAKTSRLAAAVKPVLHPDMSSVSGQRPLNRPAMQDALESLKSKTELDNHPSRAKRDEITSQLYGHEDCNKIRKVEDWLRTSTSCGQATDRFIQSPSPTVRPVHKAPQQKTKKWEAATIPFQLSEATHAVSELAKINGRELHSVWTPTDHIHHGQSASSPTSNKKSPKISPPSGITSWARVQQADAPVQHTIGAGIPIGDDTRQEDLIEKPEPTRLKPETCISEDIMDSHVPSTSLHTAFEQPLSYGPGTALPALSTETSKVRHTDELPSAQIQIQAVLNSGPSNLSSNIQTFAGPSDRPNSPDQDLISNTHIRLQDQTERRPGHAGASQWKDENPSGRQGSSPVKAGTNARQVSLGAPGQSRSLDKVITAESKSPMTEATKSISTKKKRTAFVTDERSSGSSQGSIKMAMKVAKPSALNQDKIGKIQPDVNADGEESAIENVTEISPYREKPIRGTLERKGILKSSLMTSTEVMASSTHEAQASTNQDAQRPAKLKLIESGMSRLKDDDFDLEGVMDDLGSFLGTWDQQQEAVGLKASV